MSRTLQACIPSCDVETLEALAYVKKTTWDQVFQAAMLYGMWFLSRERDRKIDPQTLDQLCLEAHLSLEDIFERSSDTATWQSMTPNLVHTDGSVPTELKVSQTPSFDLPELDGGDSTSATYFLAKTELQLAREHGHELTPAMRRADGETWAVLCSTCQQELVTWVEDKSVPYWSPITITYEPAIRLDCPVAVPAQKR